MSLAPLALAFQNAFSRASMSAAPDARGQHVHVEGAELGDELGQLGGVLLDPLVVAVLEHHDQVGQRLVLDLGRHAELEVGGPRHRRHGDEVDVLEDRRHEPGADDRRDGRGDVLHRWRRGSGW